jgi:MFS transporter, OPA family, glycerol-3-phosphate transporter
MNGYEMNSKISVNMDLIHRSYDRWGHGILVMMILSYSVYFFVRLNFTLAMPFIETAFNLTKTELGLITTAHFFIFGVGKFVNGLFSHLLKPKVFLSIGLLGSGAMNLIIINSDCVMWVVFLWCLNSFFQSLAWPQCVRLMSDWYSSAQLGTRWGIVSVSNQLGGFIVFSVLPLLILHYGWHAVFWIPGSCAVLVGVTILFLPLDLPEDLGLPSMDARHGITRKHLDDKESSSISWSIMREIMSNAKLWYISLAMFCIYIVKTGFTTWAPTYLKDFKMLDIQSIGFSMSFFEIFGACGCLLAGVFSDKLFNGKRSQVGVLYLMGTMIFFSILWFFPKVSFLMDIAILGGVGFFISGPQVVVGVSSVEFSSKQAAVAANGFVGFVSYIGSSLVSGVVIGALTQYYGWHATFGMFFFFSGLAIFFFWIVHLIQQKEDRDQNSNRLKT